jgi:hypothetical protein
MRSIIPTLAATLAALPLLSEANDWRKTGSDERKLNTLVELVPGTAHWMAEMGDRYTNLYWAVHQEKWEFAAYQAEEIEKLMHIVMLARPARAESAQIFMDRVFPDLHEAAESRDREVFEASFRSLNGECMACHVREDHGFIQIPVEPASASSPVLNMK